MASRPWDDRPLPPLPPEAHLDSAPSAWGTRPARPAHGTARDNTPITTRVGGRDNTPHPTSSSLQHNSHATAPVTTSPGRPLHSRSMSNPFPSFFSARRRRNDAQTPAAPSPREKPEDTDAGHQHVHPRPSVVQQPPHRRRPDPALGPNDFITGRCMTCASLVKWPKSREVFRCTICMTVNGVEPLSTRKESGDGTGSRDESSSSKIGAISISYTRSLVQRCLTSSLQSFVSASEEQPRQSNRNQPFVLSLRQNKAPPEDITHTQGPGHSLHYPTSSHSASSSGNASAAEGQPIPAQSSPARGAQGHLSVSYPGSHDMDLLSQESARCVEPDEYMFKGVEDYLIDCFGTHSCLNNSFYTSEHSRRAQPEHAPTATARMQHIRSQSLSAPDLSELDPKLLMVGNIAENGSWWTGGQDTTSHHSARNGRGHRHTKSNINYPEGTSPATSESLGIDWAQVMEWYSTINDTPLHWKSIYDGLVSSPPCRRMSKASEQEFESILAAAHHRLQRTFLKCTETLLKRPGTLISKPERARFLMILTCNPLLTATAASAWDDRKTGQTIAQIAQPRTSQRGADRHSGIIKRLFGLLANSSEDCHRHLVLWFTTMPDCLFLQIKDLVSSFITYRLTRQNERIVERKVSVIDGLVPQMSEHNGRTNTASLHAALHGTTTANRQKQPAEPKQSSYTGDWQIKAAARVMALIFAANNTAVEPNRTATGHLSSGRPFPISDFYHSLVDTLDFKGDFELWESKGARFTFCQYPFFLSIWAKIQILEHDAKRQMAGKAREAFFDSILSHRAFAKYLTLKIRRDCLVDDSLKQVSGIVGSGSEDIKKALRIEFDGEEGVDAGGLRKEWFLLLVREVFNPDHGLFTYDNDSQLCYFNPYSFETSDQYFLVGVVLGLAIYNSTILDIALPPFAFRKLLAASPPAGSAAHTKPAMTYTLDDLAELRPLTARGLRQLLEYDGDVQADLCLDFVAEVDRYGSRVRVPLCPGGEHKMVTASNRREYVDLFVRYHLDTAVTRQFEPFKRGFFTVCGGNALSLFRHEEIELLVRGSDEPLDVKSLQGAADYSQWPKDSPPDTEPTIQWFWQTFEEAQPPDQRRLLAFITGSDRIPATGAAALTIRINCLGDDEGRFPSARTCFNMLSLYRSKTRARLEETLWRAVYESEGFGLK
ncbi:hypothetical protein Micbo1qcDRAFT_156214 [Microdochium bolleyi]|uniref:HECT-type E3 ubiquitin transferase n=1 Tax=Microdochium bolleyi TaxID=196109 RepID=A0A136JJN7_9PEZI|nr:hypothetical protein Micbo1qcDRAFT_156214 [Microdochium bolleyi]